MESDKVNRWLTLGANIGVLIGIILLIVELDQNREMIRAQTRNDISQQLANRLLTVAGNSQMASLHRRAEAGEELTRMRSISIFFTLSPTCAIGKTFTISTVVARSMTMNLKPKKLHGNS